MHSIVTTFRGAVIKVEVANFCAAMDTLIDQDVFFLDVLGLSFLAFLGCLLPSANLFGIGFCFFSYGIFFWGVS